MEESLKKLELTHDERLMVRVHEYAKFHETESVRKVCWSLLAWYRRHGFWTGAQKAMAGSVCGQMRKLTQKTAKPKKYCLYAVRLGVELKVGVTSNLVSRMKAYRTSHSDAELMHEIDLGECTKKVAARRERLLHKYLRKRRHWIVRELFDLAALPAIRAFKGIK